MFLLRDTTDELYPVYMQSTSSSFFLSRSWKFLTKEHLNKCHGICNCQHEGHAIYEEVDKECVFAGPTLVTLCTAVFDLHALTCTIFQGNPQKHVVYSQLSLVFPSS
jgi:hypothetical protein